MKRPWKTWIVELIKETKLCYGDEPPFGSASNEYSEEEFKQSLKALKPHKYNDCHFVEEVMGIEYKNVKKIETDDSKVMENLEDRLENLEEIKKGNNVLLLKRNLKLYVDRIHFRKDGSLSVPKPLLELSQYINNFFEGKE